MKKWREEQGDVVILAVPVSRKRAAKSLFYRTDTQQYRIYLPYTMKKPKVVNGDVIYASVLQ